MKGQFLVATIFMACLGLFACQNKQPTGDMVVEIPWYKEGRYQISKVKLNGVTSMDPFFGAHAAFTVGPKISETEMAGDSANVRYMKSKDVLIPRDDISAEVLTVYAHFQKLHELDKKLGIADKLRWPRRIGLRVLTTIGDSGIVEDNALYFEPLDATFIVPYTRGEVPLSINPGIVAHEHFHAIFNKVAMHEFRKFQKVPIWLRVHGARATEADLRDYSSNIHLYSNDTFMRGMNEGFADFWGWLYSGDSNFIVRSLPNAKSRSLEGKPRPFPSVMQMQSVLSLKIESAEEEVTRFAYQELTQRYSQFLKRLADSMGPGGAIELAKIIIQILPGLGQELAEKYSEKSYSTMLPLKKIIEKIPAEHKIAACKIYAEYSPVIKVVSSEEGKAEKIETTTDAPLVQGCQEKP